MKLSGLKVLDLSTFLPGPMLTMMMADHGAEVIKVEPTGAGEPTRGIGAVLNGQSVYFRNTQRGKRSIQLDLKTAGDLALCLELAAEADVVVEAWRPGVADRLGVGYAAIKALNRPWSPDPAPSASRAATARAAGARPGGPGPGRTIGPAKARRRPCRSCSRPTRSAP